MVHDLSRIIDHQIYLVTQRCLDEIRGGSGKHAGGEGRGGGDGGGGNGRRRSGGDTWSSSRRSTPSPGSPRLGRSPKPTQLGRSSTGGETPAPRDSGSNTFEAALARLGFRDPEEFYRVGGERPRTPGREEEHDDDIYGATPVCSPQGPPALGGGNGASAPPPAGEEDDIYGATPLGSPQHSQGGGGGGGGGTASSLSSSPQPSPRSHPVESSGIYGAARSRSPSPPRRQLGVPQGHHPTAATPQPPPSPNQPEPTPKEDQPPPPDPHDNGVDPNHHLSQPLPPPTPGPNNIPTTTTDKLSAITSLTLIAEDVPELATFYAAVFDDARRLPGPHAGGAEHEAEDEDEDEDEEVTLALNGGALHARLLSSRAARRRRALGPDVPVGRSRDAGRRVMLGARVRDVEAVHARLKGLGGAGGLVNELTAVGAGQVVGGAGGRRGRGRRKSVMFWDPAGHCWEVWEEEGER